MKRISSAPLILIVSIGIFAWMMRGVQTDLPSELPQTPQVESYQIELGHYPTRLHVHGQTKSRLNPSIVSKITADVDQLYIHEGDHVDKNQVLVQLKSQKIELSLQQSMHQQEKLWHEILQFKNHYRLEKKTYKQQKHLQHLKQKEVNRLQYLFEHGQIARAKLEQAQQHYLQTSMKTIELETQVKNHDLALAEHYEAYHAQKKQVQKAVIDYERLKIRAPYSGVIQSISVKKGDRVQVNKQVVEMFSVHALEVHTSIPQESVQYIKQPQTRAHIYHKGGLTQLRLKALEHHIDPTTASQTAIFQALEPDHLILGAWHDVIIQKTSVQQSALVPKTALYFNDTIYAINQDKQLEAITVDVVGQSMDMPEFVVVEGTELHEGQTIMTTHLPYAETGMTVSLWNGQP